MSTDNVLMHSTDIEGGGAVIRRKTERWILQTRLFLDSKWGKLQHGLLSADEEGRRVGSGCGGCNEGRVFPELGK